VVEIPGPSTEDAMPGGIPRNLGNESKSLDEKLQVRPIPIGEETTAGVTSESEYGPGIRWLLEHVRHSVFKMKLNRVITAVGPPGSGKSWTGLLIGSILDPEFNVDRVVFPGLDYIRAIANPDLGIGSFVQWDDAGLGAPSREFYTQLNKAVGLVAQSSRFRRLIVWLTLPDKSFLDAIPRKLVDVHLEFISRKQPEDPVEARVYLPRTNPKKGNIYYEHPRIYHPDQGTQALEIIEFRTFPPKALSDAYENKKHDYMMGFYRDLAENLDTGGVRITDHTAKILLVLWDYGQKLGKTQADIADAIGIRRDSFNRALRKARDLSGWSVVVDDAEAR
jgi:hypothetical protein